MPRIFATKIQWREVGQIPGAGDTPGFTLAIWVCTSVAQNSTVFQSHLYCKTIIRFSPSFRKNVQHFHFIKLLDLTQKPMMITENLKKSIRVKASRPLVFEKTSIEIQLLKIQRENLRSFIFHIVWTRLN